MQAGMPAMQEPITQTEGQAESAPVHPEEIRASVDLRIGKNVALKTTVRMTRQDARRMIVRRALKAGIITRLGCHTFRATGITVYLLNGGLLGYAQQMAAHESARTTKLYERRNDQVTLDQVERIVL
jgi:integrase